MRNLNERMSNLRNSTEYSCHFIFVTKLYILSMRAIWSCKLSAYNPGVAAFTGPSKGSMCIYAKPALSIAHTRAPDVGAVVRNTKSGWNSERYIYFPTIVIIL